MLHAIFVVCLIVVLFVHQYQINKLNSKLELENDVKDHFQEELREARDKIRELADKLKK